MKLVPRITAKKCAPAHLLKRMPVIHCLAADRPGAAVNNPRQVAPYHYSQRFGPLPPCFSLDSPTGRTATVWFPIPR